MRTAVGLDISTVSINTTAILRVVVHDQRTAHRGPRHKVEAAALSGRTVAHHAVTHVCTTRHDGTTTARIRIAGTGQRSGATILQPYAINNGRLSQSRRSGPSAESHRMITIHFLRNCRTLRRLGYRTQHGSELHRITHIVTCGVIPSTAFFIITIVIITIIISSHKSNSFRNDISITLRINC